ncbi:MAG: hypothetical protein FWF82_06140, partial [Oscillospiraceae bacterium]|nr:hypothetical protein [Oscillospiraceae bacterium]
MNKMKKFFINALILLLNIIIIVAFMSVILDGESIPAAVAIAVIPIFGVFALIKKNWFVYLPNTPEETDETPNQVSKRKISLSDKKSMAIV